ncbi:DUF2797 domain-containing protein [Catenovulum maritimum]|uniref:DUF2797 domain-containing protein n=1 Tax=Catenovulum maritimum TaxID=1513271 RepID=A0A0J8GRI5_9ALTE|nr:DUF2797 domain-containing protein [Catenovulum maritimum]KMT65317.1 hypothetical protein XM47_09805 [Catenovulum maritimum]
MIGFLKKLQTELTSPVSYNLPLNDELINLNQYIGQKIRLKHTGNIRCLNCQKKTNKSYSQGHCFNCMRKLASCDMCIMKPETCHHSAGTCREPEWGEQNCMIPHYVYLANTSGLKVGITRHSQVPTRWIDQGATQALPIFKVQTRLQSGLVEIALAEFIADKTNWRNLLKGNPEDIDLNQKAVELKPLIEQKLAEIVLQYGADAVESLDDEIVTIEYPVTQFPTKITSYNFDKQAEIQDTLVGIKGQYLIFESGVINIRKFTSYEVEFEALDIA